MKYIWNEYGKPILAGVIIVILVQHFLFQFYKVDGDSMYPNLHNEERMFVSKLGDIGKNDVIILKLETGERLVKRVVATAGDEIEMKDDTLYLNGKEMDEKYLDKGKKLIKERPFTSDIKKVTVPKGSVFVLGDNRPNSADSRYFGFIPEENIVGEVKSVVWPLNEIRTIK